MRITKAFIPAAGRGTRLMPLTLHQPKGMVGVLDKPMIHYPLQELRDAGITHIVIAVGPDQPQYKQYTDHLSQLPEWTGIKFDFVIQPKPVGSSDALLRSEHLFLNEPFVVHFCDNVIHMKPSMTEMLISHFEEHKVPIVPLERVPRAIISQYATTRFTKVKPGLYQLHDIIEKPTPSQIMSYYSVMPSNILTPDFFPFIRKAKKKFIDKKEIAIADVLSLYIKSHPVYGWKFEGTVFNTGLKEGLLQAHIHAALQDPLYKAEIKKFIKKIK